jgi:hypothetical protein
MQVLPSLDLSARSVLICGPGSPARRMQLSNWSSELKVLIASLFQYHVWPFKGFNGWSVLLDYGGSVPFKDFALRILSMVLLLTFSGLKFEYIPEFLRCCCVCLIIPVAWMVVCALASWNYFCVYALWVCLISVHLWVEKSAEKIEILYIPKEYQSRWRKERQTDTSLVFKSLKSRFCKDKS